MRYLLFLIFSLLSVFATAQDSLSGKYRVVFSDKQFSAYSITTPEAFLSKRAIERRNKQGLTIDETDIPVSQQYIDSLKTCGAQVLLTSRWFNYALVAIENDSIFNALRQLKCISRLEKRGELYENNNFKNLSERKFKFEFADTGSSIYGKSYAQINQLNGLSLHRRNYKGQGMVIGVLDAGFYQVDRNAAFDSLWAKSLILGTRDFAEQGSDVYLENYHGASVLSLMACNVPGKLVGTAPEAQYWLIRTEDDGYELPLEEDNWVAGAEFADSVGCDIINSSLGYNLFDEIAYNHTHTEYDGKTIICSRAATMCARKGMVVVVSAGNEGAKPWRRITTPGDADSVLTVGAVNENGEYSLYSSQGPSADGRVKPDIVAMGTKPTFVSSIGKIDNSSRGTSFAAPIIAGMVACLWQEFPKLTNMQIVEAVRKSASNYYHPDNLMGYGIPDFQKARIILRDQQYGRRTEVQRPYPNPFTRAFTIDFVAGNPQDSIDVTISSLMGAVVLKKTFLPNTFINNITIDQLADLSDGVYFVAIKKHGTVYNERVIKVKQ